LSADHAAGRQVDTEVFRAAWTVARGYFRAEQSTNNAHRIARLDVVALDRSDRAVQPVLQISSRPAWPDHDDAVLVAPLDRGLGRPGARQP
jgi:hypothetical protein